LMRDREAIDTFRCYRRLPLLKTVRARPELQPQDHMSGNQSQNPQVQRRHLRHPAPSVLFRVVK